MTGHSRSETVRGLADGAGDRSQVIDGVDVDVLAAAVISCPSVSGLLSGSSVAAITLLPGRRVSGVRVTRTEVQVEVRSRWGATAAMLAREVRVATERMLAGHRLNIVIGDIDDPMSESRSDAASATAGALPTPLAVPVEARRESEAVGTPSPPPSPRRSQSSSRGELF